MLELIALLDEVLTKLSVAGDSGFPLGLYELDFIQSLARFL
jgi:hypothetical protein